MKARIGDVVIDRTYHKEGRLALVVGEGICQPILLNHNQGVTMDKLGDYFSTWEGLEVIGHIDFEALWREVEATKVEYEDAKAKDIGGSMKVRYQCSNCGQRFQSSAMVGVPDGMYISGCRVVGDAFYCEDCVKTWADRNGKKFDEQYKDPKGMFTKWWNRLVEEQAKAEGKTVKTYRVVNGEYEEA